MYQQNNPGYLWLVSIYKAWYMQYYTITFDGDILLYICSSHGPNFV
jgi:hypothetical protein